MKYVYQYKVPFDEVAEKLQMLPQLQLLAIGVNREHYDIHFLEFLLENILRARGIRHARCFNVPKAQLDRDVPLQEPLLLHFQHRLQSCPEQNIECGQGGNMEMAGMYRLLQAIKLKQSMQSTEGQGHSYLNPADVLED